jgi:ferritin-like metal-binding protein YciE
MPSRETTMGIFTRDLKSLEDLLLHGLKDIYYVENQIVENLPKMIDAATDAELKRGLKDHLKETKIQVERLNQVFELLGEEPKGKRCPGIDGILSEGDELLGNVEGRIATNAAIVAAAQSVEHYEITRYGTLIAWAEEIGKEDIIPLLRRNLREEKAADKKLSAVAEGRVNKGLSRGQRPAARRTTKRKVAQTAVRRKRPSARRRTA